MFLRLNALEIGFNIYAYFNLVVATIMIITNVFKKTFKIPR